MKGRDRFDAWAALVTLSGLYKLENVEMAFRIRRSGRDIFVRHQYFETREDVETYLRAHEIEASFEPRAHADGRWSIPFTFKDAAHLRAFARARFPGGFSLEFGPLYLGKNRAAEKTDPYLQVRRPLVFDVDVDEVYARRRTCACGPEDTKKVCDVCWAQLMVPAMQELRRVLTDMFGFRALLFVFSGRRGFHAWVLDREVWAYTSEQRAAVCSQIVDTRLDENLRDDLYHLIKAPLLQHPGSGQWAVPIDESFRPSHCGRTVDWEKHVALIDKKVRDGRGDHAVCKKKR